MLEPRSSGILDILTRITRDVLQNMDPKLIAGDEIVWDKDLETLLFYAMHGMKPVGVNRHFMMAVISKRFGSYINKKNFDSQIIWDHLETLYDMAALHESEVIPFPNEEVEFELPDEFDEVAMERHGATIPHSQKDESETLKNNSKNIKRLSSAKLKPNATPNSKNTFQTPLSNKSTKNHRSDSRASSVESNAKAKQEPVSSGRGNKSSRASSPHSTKTAKSETSTVESSATPVSASQKNKTDLQENKDKKTPKNEPTPSSSKKAAKTETVSSSKQGKPDGSDSVGKKVKNEKEASGKKGKVSLTSESSSKKRESTKGESKREVESKRLSEASSAKSKSDKEKSSKSNKNEDADSTQPSGTRKSASLRVETDQKKRKRTEDSGKKETPPARRRRTANP